MPVVIFACWVIFCQFSQVYAAAKSEAYLGEPFGVGKITIDVLRGEPVLPLSDERFTVQEASGRVMYPALKQETIRRLVRGLLDLEAPRKVTIYYLFQGKDPFDLSPYTPYEQGIRVKPLNDAARHRKLLREWWEQYTKYYESLLKNRAYPPIAENFLIATLSRRLDLPMPEPSKGFLSDNRDQDYALSYLMVDEAHRLRVDRALLRQVTDEHLELMPLPEPHNWPAIKAADAALDEVAVEPMAQHVPAECFYVRFGDFPNYLWFRDLNKKWQGDLGNMILRRGILRGAGKRTQEQLSLRESALAKVLGPQVIADAAIIGLDHYAEQGAAIGILFQAKNDFLLSTDLMKQRLEALKNYDDAQQQTVEITGQQVSLVSTPGGEVRSYYVQQDGFHLVTTSQTLVARFLQAGKGDRSLAALPSFRRARQEFPLERNDTVFAFVSEQYWRQLSSPHYIVENLRRVRSSRESILLELARLTAQCERKSAFSSEELIAAGILPQQFAQRADGSELLASDLQIIDSLRGKRGYYLPIADMPVEKVTKQEAATFQRFRDKLKTSTGQLPPVAAAFQRTPIENSALESLTVDVFAQGKIRKLLGKAGSWLGQPAQQRLQPVEGDIFACEAVVNFPSSPLQGEDLDHHLFGALRDYRSPLAIKQGAVQPGSSMTELVRGYVGAWPKPGLLAWFTGTEGAQGETPEQLGGELWQAKQDDFLLISFKSDVINQVLPQLTLQPAERAAQLWVRLGDLTDTMISESVTALGYMRTRDTSAAGSRMMNSLANQLRVPRNECRAVAERLVDGEFVCPLGGEYQLYEPDRGLEVWASSALPQQNRFLLREVPEDFRLPLLDWFRGLQGDLRLDDQALSIHLEIKTTAAALP